MKRYHTLTQAHINRAFQDVVDTHNARDIPIPSHAAIAFHAYFILKKRGMNPRQLESASTKIDRDSEA